jgi:hypothetical protein
VSLSDNAAPKRRLEAVKAVEAAEEPTHNKRTADTRCLRRLRAPCVLTSPAVCFDSSNRPRLPVPRLGPVAEDDEREAQKEGDMTETSDQVITREEQAAAVKAALAPVDVSSFPPTWMTLRFATADLAVGFANQDPKQKAGEAVFPVGDDGVVDLFFYFHVP